MATSDTTFSIDQQDETITITTTGGAYKYISTNKRFGLEKLKKGKSYRLYAEAEKIDGYTSPYIAIRGIENEPNTSAYFTSVNEEGNFIDFIATEYMNSISLGIT